MLPKESTRILLALFLGFLALVAFVLSGFLTPIVLGVLLASLSANLYERLSVALGNRANLAALLIVAAIVLLIILPFLGLATLITKEAFDLLVREENGLPGVERLPGAVQSFLERLRIDPATIFEEQVAPLLENLGLFLSRQLGTLLSNAFALTLDFFIIMLTVFYLLRDGKRLGAFLLEVSPLPDRDSHRLYRTFRDTGRAVLYGNFVSALAQGILGGIGFLIFGLPSPVIWGTVMAFLALIPLLGAYLVFIPAAGYLFLKGETLAAILFLAYNIFLVSTVDNIIKPKMISARTKIHPLFAVLAIFGGIKVFGLLGIIYGPLIAATFLALFDIYKEKVKPELTSTHP